MFRSTYEQLGQSSDSQMSTDVFESELTGEKPSHSSFAGSTETNFEVRSDNSLVAPPPSFVSGVQSPQQLPSMALNMTPELHSPTASTPSDISSESESAVDRPQPCSPLPSHYKWSQSEQIDELAERFLGAHRAFDVFEFVPQSSFRLFYCLPKKPKNPKVVAFKLTLTVAYRSNSGETYPYLNNFTGEIEDFPVWLPCVRTFVQ
ncbi:hypothetical protein M3Y98_00856800 [Aphelenchoides besseyi]|nr:hypothetical protein M3Y98_00856800 [Aphelenchoides besseyi]KAI6211138.1 hypothetical protein M3Y96_00401900 [Aphelenchoides besseyi]